MYFVLKVINRQVRQIVFCPETKIVSDELVSGDTLKKLSAAGKVFEIAPELIIERFSMFRELTDQCAYSKFYSFGINNWELYIESGPKPHAIEAKQTNNKTKAHATSQRY